MSFNLPVHWVWWLNKILCCFPNILLHSWACTNLFQLEGGKTGIFSWSMHVHIGNKQKDVYMQGKYPNQYLRKSFFKGRLLNHHVLFKYRFSIFTVYRRHKILQFSTLWRRYPSRTPMAQKYGLLIALVTWKHNKPNAQQTIWQPYDTNTWFI